MLPRLLARRLRLHADASGLGRRPFPRPQMPVMISSVRRITRLRRLKRMFVDRDLAGGLVFFVSQTTAADEASFEAAVCASSQLDSTIFHVGLMINSEEIVHATPSRGVQRESLVGAIEDIQPAAVEFYSMGLEERRKLKAIDFALKEIGAGYNDIFSSNMRDSTGRRAFYCCQLVGEAYGRATFNPHTLNFLGDDGEILPYWIQYYAERGIEVPQGGPGTHPSVLRASPVARFRARHEISLKGFSVPKNFLDGLHFISGNRQNLLPGREHFNVHEPRTGQLVATVDEALDEEVDIAVDYATPVQREWETQCHEKKDTVLKKAASLIREQVETLATWESRTTGQPKAVSKKQIFLAADIFDFYSSLNLKEDHRPISTSQILFDVRRAHGIIAGFGSWQAPFLSAARQIAPALACGNAIIFNPSKLAPVSAVLLVQLLQFAGVPDGLVDVLQGGEATAKAILRCHSVQRAALPTGSVVHRQALPSAELESIDDLGAVSCIVLDNVDLELAAREIVKAVVATKGLVRVFVHLGVSDFLAETLVEVLSGLEIGDPLEQVAIGAFPTKAAFDDLASAMHDAAESGAKIVIDGIPSKPPVPKHTEGFYALPSIVTDVTPSMDLFQSSIRAPAILLIDFDDDDDIAAFANFSATQHPPWATSIFTSYLSRAHDLVTDLSARHVFINAFEDPLMQKPYGSASDDVARFTTHHTVTINTSGHLEGGFRTHLEHDS